MIYIDIGGVFSTDRILQLVDVQSDDEVNQSLITYTTGTKKLLRFNMTKIEKSGNTICSCKSCDQNV